MLLTQRCCISRGGAERTREKGLGLGLSALPATEPDADTMDDPDREKRGCSDQQWSGAMGSTEHN